MTRWVAVVAGRTVVAALLVALPVGALDVEWVYVDDPGNPPDTAANCLNEAPDCGSVPYAYSISKYEITNVQYAEFLNAKAAADPLGLYNPSMGSDATFGGIAQSGSPGSYSYAVKPGFASKPVNFVSFYDAARFANWLDNGQGTGDTETGAYAVTERGITRNDIAREPGATTFVPGENEWYKAAYYDASSASFFDYPTATNAPTECAAPASDTGNSANCSRFPSPPELTDVGAYGLSESPAGTFDQGGNAWEWNEETSGPLRGLRGGGLYVGASGLAASGPFGADATAELEDVGFRVATLVPEPAHALLVLTGGLVLAEVRQRRPVCRRRASRRWSRGSTAGSSISREDSKC